MSRALLPLLLLVSACGRGGDGGSPTCGIALIAGPSLITQQLNNARAVLTDPPRGLPDSLPALVIQQKTGAGAVIVGRNAEGKLSMQYRGPGFPAQGYGLLVVDDTSQRAMGVLILESQEPAQHPRIGSIIGGGTALNLYGVRVDWSGVSNPRCPLFGAPASPTS
jgi:hypothetical protein